MRSKVAQRILDRTTPEQKVKAIRIGDLIVSRNQLEEKQVKSKKS